ncbi:MAG: hypothetical protein OXG90_01710, partial [Gammaproteobacteria bacterium]|nr:hypothetical protein [Gammaproteobacteria bacterium]
MFLRFPVILSRSFAALFFLAAANAALAQMPQLTRVEEDDANIELDGFVDEPVWDRIPVVD